MVVRLAYQIFLAVALVSSHWATASQSPDTRVIAANLAFSADQQKETLSTQEYRVLITQERFAELEEELLSIERKYAVDPAEYETLWLFSYLNLEDLAARKGSEEALLHYFDLWIKQSQTHVAYAARAHFRMGLAWAYRGKQYSAKTSTEAFQKMRRQISFAQEDFSEVLDRKPDFLPAHERLIEVGMLTSNAAIKANHFELGLKYAPNSFWIRSKFMESLEPIWGGSYEKMGRFLSQSDKALDANPRLWRLHGAIDASRAQLLESRGDYDAAVFFYRQALEFGDKYKWLNQKAYCHYRLAEYGAAIKDLKHLARYGRGAEQVEMVVDMLEHEQETGMENRIFPSEFMINVSH